VLEEHNIVAVLRAHQHAGPMLDHMRAGNGISRLWQQDKENHLHVGGVYTFLASPDMFAGREKAEKIQAYDAFGILKLQATFADCTLEAVNIDANEMYPAPSLTPPPPRRNIWME
jgi:hypothetical protein